MDLTGNFPRFTKPTVHKVTAQSGSTNKGNEHQRENRTHHELSVLDIGKDQINEDRDSGESDIDAEKDLKDDTCITARILRNLEAGSSFVTVFQSQNFTTETIIMDPFIIIAMITRKYFVVCFVAADNIPALIFQETARGQINHQSDNDPDFDICFHAIHPPSSQKALHLLDEKSSHHVAN